MKKVIIILIFIIASVLGKMFVQYIIKNNSSNNYPNSSYQEKSFNIDGNNYTYKKDAEGASVKINNDFYELSDAEIEQFVGKSLNYIDKKSLKTYFKVPGNLDRLKQATGAYGFIAASEKSVSDWCKPYYTPKIFQTKLKNQFALKKEKAKNIIKEAFGKNWEQVFKEMTKETSIINKQQMDDDYKQVKIQANKNGENMSKYDYCKMIDEGADWFVGYKNKLFRQMYPNF